jgi:hypothetical protein
MPPTKEGVRSARLVNDAHELRRKANSLVLECRESIEMLRAAAREAPVRLPDEVKEMIAQNGRNSENP